MKVTKSTRHSKITGNFSENLILYWLSKYGFESATVDHTGIDIISRNPHTNELMGISAKSRSRNTGKEGQYLLIPNESFAKANAACKTFDCVPYFAIVVDEENSIYCFITSATHLLELHPMRKNASGWKMSKKWIEAYKIDPEIKMFIFEHKTINWWDKNK